MAWRYREDRWEDGDLATPHELVVELGVVASEFNGMLDRDNFGTAALDESKFELDTFNTIEVVEAEGATEGFLTFTKRGLAAGSDWQEVRAASPPSPGDAVIEMETPDCGLEISFCLDWRFATTSAGLDGLVGWAIAVDDEIVVVDAGEHHVVDADGGTYPKTQQNNTRIGVVVPVGAGRHRIVGLVRIMDIAWNSHEEPSVVVDRRLLAVRAVQR